MAFGQAKKNRDDWALSLENSFQQNIHPNMSPTCQSVCAFCLFPPQEPSPTAIVLVAIISTDVWFNQANPWLNWTHGKTDFCVKTHSG